MKLEDEQDREGEEQAMGDQGVQRLPHAPPSHHSPLDQHFLWTISLKIKKKKNALSLSLSIYRYIYIPYLRRPNCGNCKKEHITRKKGSSVISRKRHKEEVFFDQQKKKKTTIFFFFNCFRNNFSFSKYEEDIFFGGLWWIHLSCTEMPSRLGCQRQPDLGFNACVSIRELRVKLVLCEDDMIIYIKLFWANPTCQLY